jgi:diguanylate cyclase (GGDEF)-like protein
MNGSMGNESATEFRRRRGVALGIRSGLLVGFSAIAAAAGLAVLVAVIAVTRVGESVEVIVGDRLPIALSALSLAHRADELLAAAAPLLSVTSESARAEQWRKIESHIGEVRAESERLNRQGMSELASSIVPIADRLVGNLDKLDGLVRVRIALHQSKLTARGALLNNMQMFQGQTNYLSRRLAGDAAVAPRKSAAGIAELRPLAMEMARLVPIARLDADVTALNGILQAAADAPSAADLEMARVAVEAKLTDIDRTARDLDPSLSTALGGPLRDLRWLVRGDAGLLVLRGTELRVLDELNELLGENEQISRQMDQSAHALVADSLTGVDQATDIVARVKSTSVAILLVVIFGMMAGVGLLMRFYVGQHLLRRLAWLSDAMLAIADGKFDTKMPPEGADELGRLGSALAKFRSTALQAERREFELRALNVRAEESLSALKTAQNDLVRQARTDFLTGLANRQSFMESAQREWERAQHGDEPIALLMLDLDHFKRINDRYGHSAGDKALQAVACVCAEALRPTDLVGRVGGEEFAALLPGAALQGGMDAAERIRAAVSAKAVQTDGGRIAHLTISIGVAVKSGSDESLAEALARADAALYSAKQAGRNRVGVPPETLVVAKP